MPAGSTNLSLPYIQPSQAQKHVTHNEALQTLDALVQLAVESRGQTVPPSSPAEGERHIVAPAATGAWSGQEGRVAIRAAGAWQFHAPKPGWRAFVADEARIVVWQGGVWGDMPLPELDNLHAVGVNATADTTNRLAVSAPATLLGHEGAGHRLKINKAAAGDTASLLFQTGFSGRAEMGLSGTDDFAIKISSDGSSWTTALNLDSASGHLTGAAVQSGSLDAAEGVLLKLSGDGKGAFGLGGEKAETSDLDTTLRSGWYRYTGSDPSRPPSPVSGGGGFMALAASTIWAHQIAYPVLENNLYTRFSVDGGSTWSAWRPLIPQGGSNANGEFVRYGDGTQVCTNGNSAITTPAAAFVGTITKLDGDKLWLGRWF